MDFEAILNEAHAAATAAIEAKGPENMNALDCGFAWVTISGNEPLARHCRKMLKGFAHNMTAANARRHYGDRSMSTPGWQWWGPGRFNGQAIGHKEAGARAFRDVLAKYGIRAEVGSRLD